MMDIQKDYFDIFGLPHKFDIDLTDLAARYRKLQRQVHPDRFANATDRDKRLAEQYTSYVNEAYNALCSPLHRAEYLLTLQGVQTDPNQTTADNAFLMQQMALREELAEVREKPAPAAALDAISAHIDECLQQHHHQFVQFYESGAYADAQGVVAKLHFITKLAHEVEQLEVELLDY